MNSTNNIKTMKAIPISLVASAMALALMYFAPDPDNDGIFVPLIIVTQWIAQIVFHAIPIIIVCLYYYLKERDRSAGKALAALAIINAIFMIWSMITFDYSMFRHL